MSLQKIGWSFIFISLALLSTLISRMLIQANLLKQTIHNVCDLVENRIYDHNYAPKKWSEGCHSLSDQVSLFTRREAVVRALQDQLQSLGVSHLNLYEPREDKRLWQGLNWETGLRLREFSGGEFIVVKVLLQSPAALAGFKVGDQILSLNGVPLRDVHQATRSEGQYKVVRGKEELQIYCEPAEVKIDQKPSLQVISHHMAVLRISSFRAEYFTPHTWRPLIQRLSSFKQVVIDLRGNIGGNFGAMLRALSPFFCQPTSIGTLVQPRKQQQLKMEFPDSLKDQTHFDLLEKSGHVRLVTYEGYGCYRGAIALLVDAETASVAEIFTAGVKEFQRGYTVGEKTAGRVLLATWYDIKTLGPGYSLSIPEALFVNLQNQSIEGTGVKPDIVVALTALDFKSEKDPQLKRATELLATR